LNCSPYGRFASLECDFELVNLFFGCHGVYPPVLRLRWIEWFLGKFIPWLRSGRKWFHKHSARLPNFACGGSYPSEVRVVGVGVLELLAGIYCADYRMREVHAVVGDVVGNVRGQNWGQC
jgi:hypothetical protein